MKKNKVFTCYCLDKKSYWNGHFITVLCDEDISKGIMTIKKRITDKDYDVLSRLKDVYYV